MVFFILRWERCKVPLWQEGWMRSRRGVAQERIMLQRHLPGYAGTPLARGEPILWNQSQEKNGGRDEKIIGGFIVDVCKCVFC